MSDSRIEHLGHDECLRLIARGGIGRIGYQSLFGPVILPVNYQVQDDVIVFRTAEHSPVDKDLQTGIAGAEFKVAFEIDELDLTARSGWSVLVRGSAHRVRPGSEHESAEATGVEPWPGGERDVYLRIVPDLLTGYRICSR